MTQKKYICGSQQYKTIRSFGDNIYTGKLDIDEAEMGQSNLLKSYLWKCLYYLSTSRINS